MYEDVLSVRHAGQAGLKRVLLRKDGDADAQWCRHMLAAPFRYEILRASWIRRLGFVFCWGFMNGATSHA